LSGRMSPEETVSKLRSTPAPSLTAALGAKPEVGPAPNRYAAPASVRRGPYPSLVALRALGPRPITRSRSAERVPREWSSTHGRKRPPALDAIARGTDNRAMIRPMSGNDSKTVEQDLCASTVEQNAHCEGGCESRRTPRV
jgi:hypothetical protein